MNSKANKHPLIAKTLARWLEYYNKKIKLNTGLVNAFKDKKK